MINRFRVKVNNTVKQFKELNEATFYIDKLERLGYNAELYFVTMGIYEEHSYFIYSTLERSNIKANLNRLGITV